MNQIIYNSFPRSGNVYSGHVGSRILVGSFATVHIPEIFSVKELSHITIFRKPSDAISSLINKHLEVPGYSYSERLESTVQEHIDMYKKYMKLANENKDHIYIGKFEDLTDKPIDHFINISKRFDIQLVKDYESKFNELSFTGNLWEDQYDGHIPRQKTEDRIKLEQSIAGLSIIKELNKDYQDFIKENATTL